MGTPQSSRLSRSRRGNTCRNPHANKPINGIKATRNAMGRFIHGGNGRYRENGRGRCAIIKTINALATAIPTQNRHDLNSPHLNCFMAVLRCSLVGNRSHSGGSTYARSTRWNWRMAKRMGQRTSLIRVLGRSTESSPSSVGAAADEPLAPGNAQANPTGKRPMS